MDGAWWEPAALRHFGAALLQAAGMAPHQATAVAEVAVEGDLLNHNTHGIRLLPTVLYVVGNFAQLVHCVSSHLFRVSNCASAGVGFDGRDALLQE